MKASEHMIDPFYNSLEFDVRQRRVIDEVAEKNGKVTIDNVILNVSFRR